MVRVLCTERPLSRAGREPTRAQWTGAGWRRGLGPHRSRGTSPVTWWRRRRTGRGAGALRVVCLELLDLLDEVGLLVVELLVFGPVRVELGEEVYQLVLVPQQDVKYRSWLIRVRYKHLRKDALEFVQAMDVLCQQGGFVIKKRVHTNM